MYFPKDMHKAVQDPVFRASKLVQVVLLGVVILYFVPAGLVLNTPILGAVINWIATKIPSISRWVELSTFPDSTKLFAVFIWMVIPIQTILITTSKLSRQAFIQRMEANSLRRLILDFLRIFLLLGCYVSLAALFAIVDTSPCSRGCANSSKWALLFIGCIYALGVSGFTAVGAWYVVLIFKSFKRQGKKHV